MPNLTEVREELAAKRKQLHDIFSEAGPDLDLSLVKSLDGDNVAKAAEIKRRNDELTDLGQKHDELAALAKMAGDNQKAHEDLSKPAGGMRFPSGGQKAGGGDGSEQRMAQPKSLGELFTESAAFKEYSQHRRQGPTVELPKSAIFGEQKTLLTETGYAPQAVRTGLIVPGALRRPVVADLIPQGTTDQIAVVYMEETTTTNAAAFTLEGNAKPESALAFTERSAPVRKIATVLPVTDELINDVAAMRSYLEARLRVFLELAEESALISGTNNTAPNFSGLLNVSGIQTQAKGTDPTPDAIYKAMVLIQTASFLDPSGVIMHPLDWQDIRLLRTADGLYIWGMPADAGPERIWGVPVVKTVAMTQNTAIVAAFDTGMQIFRREGVSFAISDQNEDFFIKNKLMLRIEERLAFAVYRPAAICTVTGV
jgi:HK97 family phage major capsid protein